MADEDAIARVGSPRPSRASVRKTDPFGEPSARAAALQLGSGEPRARQDARLDTLAAEGSPETGAADPQSEGERLLQRIGELEPQLREAKGRLIDAQERLKDIRSAKPLRPQWFPAAKFSDADVLRIAHSVGANPHQEFWWEGANLFPGTGEWQGAVTESGSHQFQKRSLSGAADEHSVSATQASIRHAREEARALEGEYRAVTARASQLMNGGGSAKAASVAASSPAGVSLIPNAAAASGDLPWAESISSPAQAAPARSHATIASQPDIFGGAGIDTGGAFSGTAAESRVAAAAEMRLAGANDLFDAIAESKMAVPSIESAAPSATAASTQVPADEPPARTDAAVSGPSMISEGLRAPDAGTATSVQTNTTGATAASAARPAAITREAATARPWEFNARQYQAAIGVHEPWIGEISNVQLGGLSGRQKAAYEAKRAAEWQASADAKGQWRDAVLGAHDAGQISPDTANVSADARQAISAGLRARTEAAQKATFEQALQSNRIANPAELSLGDRVFSVMSGRYGTVARKFAKSVRLESEGTQASDARAWTERAGALQRLSYNDLKAQQEPTSSVAPNASALGASGAVASSLPPTSAGSPPIQNEPESAKAAATRAPVNEPILADSGTAAVAGIAAPPVAGRTPLAENPSSDTLPTVPAAALTASNNGSGNRPPAPPTPTVPSPESFDSNEPQPSRRERFAAARQANVAAWTSPTPTTPAQSSAGQSLLGSSVSAVEGPENVPTVVYAASQDAAPQRQAQIESARVPIGEPFSQGATAAAVASTQPPTAHADQPLSRAAVAQTLQSYPEDAKVSLRQLVAERTPAGATGQQVNDMLRQWVQDNPLPGARAASIGSAAGADNQPTTTTTAQVATVDIPRAVATGGSNGNGKLPPAPPAAAAPQPGDAGDEPAPTRAEGFTSARQANLSGLPDWNRARATLADSAAAASGIGGGRTGRLLASDVYRGGEPPVEAGQQFTRDPVGNIIPLTNLAASVTNQGLGQEAADRGLSVPPLRGTPGSPEYRQSLIQGLRQALQANGSALPSDQQGSAPTALLAGSGTPPARDGDPLAGGAVAATNGTPGRASIAGSATVASARLEQSTEALTAAAHGQHTNGHDAAAPQATQTAAVQVAQDAPAIAATTQAVARSITSNPQPLARAAAAVDHARASGEAATSPPSGGQSAGEDDFWASYKKRRDQQFAQIAAEQGTSRPVAATAKASTADVSTPLVDALRSGTRPDPAEVARRNAEAYPITTQLQQPPEIEQPAPVARRPAYLEREQDVQYLRQSKAAFAQGFGAQEQPATPLVEAYRQYEAEGPKTPLVDARRAAIAAGHAATGSAEEQRLGTRAPRTEAGQAPTAATTARAPQGDVERGVVSYATALRTGNPGISDDTIVRAIATSADEKSKGQSETRALLRDLGLIASPSSNGAVAAAGAGGAGGGGNGRRTPSAGGAGGHGGDGGGGSDESGAKATATAVGDVAEGTDKAAASAEKLGAHFDSSAKSALRITGALFGVGLGINVAAGIARQFHQAILDSVDAERNLEISARAVAATYGQRLAPGQASAAAQVFAANPQTKGSQPEQLAAVASLSPLTKLGLNPADIEKVVTAGGQLAKIYGSDLPTTVGALKAVFEGNTDAAAAFGVQITDQAGRIKGLGATYDQLVRVYGPAVAEQKLLATVLASVATQQDNTKASSSGLADALDKLGKATDAARQHAGQVVAGPAGAVIEWATRIVQHPEELALPDITRQRRQNEGFGWVANAVGNSATDAGRRTAATDAGLVRPPGVAGKYLDTKTGQTVTPAQADARIAASLADQNAKNLVSLQNLKEAQDKTAAASTDAAHALSTVAASVGAARTANQQLISQRDAKGNELPGTIAAIQQQAGEHATVAAAIQGNRPTLGLNATDVTLIAQQRAAQDELDRQAKDVAKKAIDEVRANLVGQVGAAAPGEAKTTAQANLDRYDADQQIRQRQIQADEQAQQASRGAQIAGLNVQQLTFEQGARRAGQGIALDAGVAQGLTGHGLSAAQAQTLQTSDTSVAAKQADLKVQEAQLDEQILPKRQQLAEVEYKIGVSRRTNLDLIKQEYQALQQALPLRQQQAEAQYKIEDAHDRVKEAALQGGVVQAQIGALPASRQVEDISRAEQRLGLVAQVGRAAVLSGHPENAPEGSLDVNSLRQQYRDLLLTQPGAELQAFDTQTPVIAAQRAAQSEDLAAQARETPGRVQAAQVAQAEKKPERALAAAQNAEEQFENSAKLGAIDLERQQRALTDALQPLEQQASALEAVNKALEDQFTIQEQGATQAIISATAAADQASALEASTQRTALHVQDIADAFQRGEESAAKTVDLLAKLPPGSPSAAATSGTQPNGPQPPSRPPTPPGAGSQGAPAGTFRNPVTGNIEPLATSTTTAAASGAESKSLLKSLQAATGQTGSEPTAAPTRTSAQWNPARQSYEPTSEPSLRTALRPDIDFGPGGIHGQAAAPVDLGREDWLTRPTAAIAANPAQAGATVTINAPVSIDVASAGSGGGITAALKAQIIREAVAEFTRELDQSIDSVQVPVSGLYSPGSGR